MVMMTTIKSVVDRFRSNVNVSVESNTLSSLQRAADVVRTVTARREIEDGDDALKPAATGPRCQATGPRCQATSSFMYIEVFCGGQRPTKP